MRALERRLLVWNGRLVRLRARDDSVEPSGSRRRVRAPEHDPLSKDEQRRLDRIKAGAG
jgi:hypothetical protein